MRGTQWMVVGLMLALIHAGPAVAAQVVALEDVVVFEAHTADCLALKAAGLNDAKRLLVQASVCMKKTFALHHLTRHGRYIIENLWTELEIYDFADPKRPQLVRSITLDETHPSWGGGGLVKDGDTLLVLGTTVSAAVTMAGAPSAWAVRNLGATPELKRRTEGFYSAATRENDPADFGSDRRIVPLEGGRFEVRWDTVRPQRGVIRHRQYLRALESGATLLIDTHDETID